MKKYLITLLIGIILLGIKGFVYAGPLVEIDVTIRSVSNNNIVAGPITWSGVNPGVTKWNVADQYLEVHYACVQEQGNPNDPNDDVWYDGWGLQICTDNTVNDAEYKYTANYVTGPKKGSLAGDFSAGLIHEGGKHKLPMCWRVIAPKRFLAPVEQGYEANLDKAMNLQIYETAEHYLRRNLAENYNCWIWLKDRANDGWSDPIKWDDKYFPNPSIKWADGMLYATVVCPNGIQHAEMSFDGWGVGNLNGETGSVYGVYIYLGADFTNVAGGNYKTNKLYIQIYHE